MGTRVVGQTINLQERDGAKYITSIDSNGIRIHPASETSNTASIQLDGTGLDIKRGTTSIAEYGDNIRIGVEDSSRFVINTYSLEAYDDKNHMYFQVNDEGLTWGNNNTAATLANINNIVHAYVTDINEGGVSIHPAGDINNSVEISDHIEIKSNGTSIASYGAETRIGNEDGFHIKLGANDSEGRLSFYQGKDNEVAYITNNQLYITKSVVLQQMDLGTPENNGGLGQWSWKVHPNGQNPSRNNLNLKWIG